MCVVRVGSDVFESARMMLRVDSLQLESARLALHTLNSSGRVGSLGFESARAAYHKSVVLVESALGPFGSARVLVSSEQSWACHDRVGSTIIRVSSST